MTAVDALARVGHFAPDAVLALARRHPGVRGTRRLPRAVALSDPRAESPGESRMRLAVVLAGLPAPVSQFRVGRYRLDLAYPDLRLGIEYDGADHRTAGRARRDLMREAELARAGWELVHLGGDNSMGEMAILVGRALAARGVPAPNVSPESIAALS
ncbi:endonuclease domain-containing protein [Pseudonocardia sp.]|uniref:endonuclease domain-containing protein n=1 Tax=Pseudonocardia sp. TaxID=60912 RepID=UPI003D13F1D3